MQQASLHQKVFHDDEGAERPDTGLSEAKKAEKKRAKKARQRSARAQAAAQKGTDKAQARLLPPICLTLSAVQKGRPHILCLLRCI